MFRGGRYEFMRETDADINQCLEVSGLQTSVARHSVAQRTVALRTVALRT
jgi:hypothetical protein